MKRILSVFALTAIFSIAAFADVRLPDTPKPTPATKTKKTIDGELTIRLDKKATEAKLIIPKNRIKQLRAALDEADGADDTAIGITKTQTVVSGLFLSLAIVFGGVWFSRSRKAGRNLNKTAVAGIFVLLVGSAATIALANIAPPVQLRKISSELFNKQTFGGWKTAYGAVKIEVSEADGEIELIVPDKTEEVKN